MPATEQNPNCPNPEALSQYTTGTATEADAETIAAHLEGCPSCQKAIERLEGEPDELQAALREVKLGQPSAIDPHIQKRIAKLRHASHGTAQRVSSRTEDAPARKAVSIRQFFEQLAKSRLWTDAELAALRKEVGSARLSDSAEALVKTLHQQGRLTALQAKRLWAGRGQDLVMNDYVLLEELGKGGMGVVYKAMHRRMRRQVALKVLPARVGKDPSLLQRFQREVEAVARLSHPNIVVAFDAGEFRGSPFLVMELVEGRDLASMVRERGPFAVDQAIDCIVQAARGLEYAHQKGIVHRDVKPGNLLLGSDGTVKVLDLGLARFAADTADVATQAELTDTGVVMGTVDYMSPEQALDTKSADGRSDIYSLGMSLYYLLAGRPAYQGGTVIARILAHRDSPIPSLRAIRQDVPEPLEAAFARMVAKSPVKRPQTMAEVAQVLEQCRLGESAKLQAPSAPKTVDALSSFLNGLAADSEVATAGPKSTRPGSSTDFPGAAETVSFVPSEETDSPRSPDQETTHRRRPSMAGHVPAWLRDRRVISALGVLALLLAGVILYFRTSAGTLRIEITDPKIEVKVKGTSIVLTGAGEKEIRLEPGEKTLVVVRDGFEFETTSLILKRGKKVTARVELLDGEIIVSANGEEIGRKKLTEPDPPVTPPASNLDDSLDRAVARWVFTVGGSVTVQARTSPSIQGLSQGGWQSVNLSGPDLPTYPFIIHTVSLVNCRSVKSDDLGRLTGLTNLRHLDLRYTSVDSAAVRHIARMPLLGVLNIGGTMKLSDLTALSHLPRLYSLAFLIENVDDLAPLARLPHLRILGFWNHHKPLANLDVGQLRACPQLRQLFLSDFTTLPDQAVLDELRRANSHLRIIINPGHKRQSLGRDPMREAARELLRLDVVLVGNFQDAKEENRALTPADCDRAGQLRIYVAAIPETMPLGEKERELLTTLEGETGLLIYRNRSGADEFARWIRSNPRLDHLGFTDSDLTDAGLAELESLVGLEILAVAGTRVTPEGVKAFSQAVPNCVIISDFGLIQPQWKLPPETDQKLPGPASAMALDDELDREIANWVFSVGGNVTFFPRIPPPIPEMLVGQWKTEKPTAMVLPTYPFVTQEVSLKNCRHIGNKDLERLTQLPFLTQLNLGYTSVDGGAVRHLARMPMLEQLYLGGTIKPSDLEALSHLPQLQQVGFLADQFGDLTPMVKLPHLRVLRFYNHRRPLADLDVSQLKSCPQLRQLYLYDFATLPDDSVLEELQQANPYLRIFIGSGNKVQTFGRDPVREAGKELLRRGAVLMGNVDGGDFQPLKSAELDREGHVRVSFLEIPKTMTPSDRDRELLTSLEGEVATIFYRSQSGADEFARWVRPNGRLGSLMFNESDLSDAGLAALDGHVGLIQLHVVGTRVTRNGLEAFAKNVPNCVIASDFGIIHPQWRQPSLAKANEDTNAQSRLNP